MTTAAEFIAQLQQERRGGNVSNETEQHLKHEFRKLRRQASDLFLSAAIGSEIDRLGTRGGNPSPTSGDRVRAGIEYCRLVRANGSTRIAVA